MLVHAIGRVLICLFIVGVVGGGRRREHSPSPRKQPRTSYRANF